MYRFSGFTGALSSQQQIVFAVTNEVNRHLSHPFKRAVLKRMKTVPAHIGADIVAMFGKYLVKRLSDMTPYKESSHGAKRLAHREIQLTVREHFQKFGDNAFGGACDLHSNFRL